MKKYKVGDMILCSVETRKSGKRAIFARELANKEILPKFEEKKFEIVAMEPIYSGSSDMMYTIVVDDDMIGWEIGQFHIVYKHIEAKFAGKKFWDITARFIDYKSEKAKVPDEETKKEEISSSIVKNSEIADI